MRIEVAATCHLLCTFEMNLSRRWMEDSKR